MSNITFPIGAANAADAAGGGGGGLIPIFQPMVVPISEVVAY